VTAARKRFAVASGLPPSADEAAAVMTPGRQDVVTPAAGARAQERRTAFTWRLTAEQGIALDTMMLRLKRELGRPKLDRAEMLAALVALAGENPAVFGALVARMQEGQTS
jgi:hypothetical protein